MGAAIDKGLFKAPEVSYARQFGDWAGNLIAPPPLSPQAAGGATITSGDITVNVPASSGSPEAVGREVKAGVLSALDEAARRSRRNYAGREE